MTERRAMQHPHAHPLPQKRPAAGTHRWHGIGVSAVALAVAMVVASVPRVARAANECGPDASGQDTVSCVAVSYPAGIAYGPSSGLTISINNSAMVITGAQGVTLQTPTGPPVANDTIDVIHVNTITASGMAVTVSNSASTGIAAINVGGGTITSTGSANTVSANGGANAVNAQVTLTGGQVLNTGTGGGISAFTSGFNGAGDTTVVITGGVVQTLGRAVSSAVVGPNNTGTARIAMSGGSVLSTGADALWARVGGPDVAQVQLSGGTVAATGADGDGILASSASTGPGSFAVDVTGGSVSGGSGFGAAIHTAAAAGGTVNIGAGAVVDGSASGVALRDGDFDQNGIDENGGNTTITTAGNLKGAVLLGGGTDTLNITGGTIGGHLTGDGADALNFNLGSQSFTHAAGYAISGMNRITMNSGAVQLDSTVAGNTLTVNGGTLVLTGVNSYTGGSFLNGGVLSVANDANLGQAAGALSFNGGTLQSTASFASARAVSLGAGGGTFQTDGDLALSSGITGAGGLSKTGAGNLTLSGANSYTGSTTVAAGTLALAGAGSLAASSQVVANGSFDIAGLGAAGTSIQRLSGSGSVNLGGKALTLTAAQDTFSGSIGGTGSLALAAGTQVLEGNNTYTGGTAINAGTLQLGSGGSGGSGGSSGAIVGNVANNGTLILNRSNRLDLAGDFSGSGVIRQIGAGMTNLTGNSAAFTGSTTVEAGTLAANGVLGGSVQVLAPGRLQGAGMVGNTSVAGMLAPGNSIGTLSVNGNFTQLPGSVYQVELDPASTASDLLRVSGTASIGAGAQLQVVRAASADYILGNRYTVLTANGGVAGTYTLAGDSAAASAFVRLVDSYDAHNVYLSAEKVRNIADVADTPNQAAVGNALDSLPANTGVGNAVIWSPDDTAARNALYQLSADIHASTKTALLQDSHFLRDAAINRLRAAVCAPGSVPAQAQASVPPGTDCIPQDRQQNAAWAQVFGSWGRIASNGNAAELRRDIGGLVVGIDTRLAGAWRAGVLGGYSRTSASTRGRDSSSKTDSVHLGLYGGTEWGATALRLGAVQSWNDTDTRRSVAFTGYTGELKSAYGSQTLQVFGELGHRIEMASASIEPFASLAHVRLKSDTFSETGGTAALYAAGDNTEVSFSTLGARADIQAGAGTRLRGMLGWRHAFGETTPTSTHSFTGSVPFTLAACRWPRMRPCSKPGSKRSCCRTSCSALPMPDSWAMACATTA